MKITFTFLAFIVAVFGIGTMSTAHAQVGVSPLLIDRSVEERDTLSEVVTVVNNSSRRVRLYASVHEISVDADSRIKEFVPASMSDRSASITSWIEISRGRIELEPGESRDIPVTIRINPGAKAGQYHALIGFASGSNRDEAEAIVLRGGASGVVVRIGIDEKQSEFLRLTSFITDRFITNPAEQAIEYTVQNTGETPLSPQGSVLFYDARGREVGSVPVNTAGEVVAPGESKRFSEAIAIDGSLGRYKAYLTVEYGSKQRAAVYDTIFFYLVPTPYLVALFLVLIALCLVTAILVVRHNRDEYDGAEHGAPVVMYVRDGHVRPEREHDINLKKNDS